MYYRVQIKFLSDLLFTYFTLFPGNIVPPHVIVSALNYILTSNDPAAKHPVGVLTTLDRSKWASHRKHLQSIGNSEALELIDTSLFNLVLDDDRPGDKPEDLIRLFLHSDGSNRCVWSQE